jgi:hypothetical protein
MEIEGVRLITVHDSDGRTIDVLLFFTVSMRRHQALYVFDKKSSKEDQKIATEAIDKSKRLARMKETVRVIGMDANKPITHHGVSQGVSDLVPKKPGLARAKIRIGPDRKNPNDMLDDSEFIVRLTMDLKKGQDKVLMVPFRGNPGEMAGRVFHGDFELLMEGSVDIANIKLELYNISDSLRGW